MSAHNLLIERINRREAERIAPLCRGELLDIGCGDKPYEPILRRNISKYVGFDHPETLHARDKVDAWGSATSLPFPDDSFDTVVSFQVLEHVEEPAAMLAEAHRVLRADGVLVLTTPFMWGIHEPPRDFYRYTPFGLRYLVEAAGFSNVEITATGGYWVTAGLRFSYHVLRFTRFPIVRWAVAPIQVVAQALGALLDRLDRDDDDAVSYVTVARSGKTSG